MRRGVSGSVASMGTVDGMGNIERAGLETSVLMSDLRALEAERDEAIRDRNAIRDELLRLDRQHRGAVEDLARHEREAVLVGDEVESLRQQLQGAVAAIEQARALLARVGVGAKPMAAK